jgi:hypothetical protein
MADSSGLGRMHKRPRHDGPTSEDGGLVGPSEGYEQWEGAAPNHGVSPAFASSNDAPPYGAPSEYGNAQSANPADNPPWQQHSAAPAYPDVGAYQQQPYFFGQAHANNYNTPWAPPEQQQHQYQPGVTSYNNHDQGEPANMPYFPQQSMGSLAPANNAVDGVATSNYTDMEQVSQYAQAHPSALVTAAQREAAKESSAFYFDDASMHLKIQSLSILDNLVSRQTFCYSLTAC